MVPSRITILLLLLDLVMVSSLDSFRKGLDKFTEDKPISGYYSIINNGCTRWTIGLIQQDSPSVLIYGVTAHSLRKYIKGILLDFTQDVTIKEICIMITLAAAKTVC